MKHDLAIWLRSICSDVLIISTLSFHFQLPAYPKAVSTGELSGKDGESAREKMVTKGRNKTVNIK